MQSFYLDKKLGGHGHVGEPVASGIGHIRTAVTRLAAPPAKPLGMPPGATVKVSSWVRVQLRVRFSLWHVCAASNVNRSKAWPARNLICNPHAHVAGVAHGIQEGSVGRPP